MGIKAASKIEKFNKITEKKTMLTPEYLCKDLPEEFAVYL